MKMIYQNVNYQKIQLELLLQKYFKGSPLNLFRLMILLVEASKKKIVNSKQFSNLLKEIINKGEKTLYLAIYNSNNQRSYITVKLK